MRKTTRMRVRKQIARWRQQLRRLLGIRHGVKVEGVYYRELSAEQLSRALSRKGPGEKAYRVTFPDGSKQVIHCTARRVYADLMGRASLARYQLLDAVVMPGMRVLDARGGTGFAPAWLSRLVGPSGGVVAVEADEESVAFAVQRYAIEHLAIELGSYETLAGETDGSFDVVVCVAKDEQDMPEEAELKELWRVVVPGGAMLLGVPRGVGGFDAGSGPMLGETVKKTLTPVPLVEAIEESASWVDLLLRKPKEEA